MFEEKYNKTLEQLFLAIYFNDIDKVKAFKSQFPDIYTKKNRFQIDDTTVFDLTKLTLFNQIIWFDPDWKDEIVPLVERNRNNADRMRKFWQSEFINIESGNHFEYHQFKDYFFCEDIGDIQSVMLDPMPYFINKGYREVDLKLYNRVDSFDFDAVRELLEKGARPNIHFHDDGDSSAICRIAEECSFLINCRIIPEFEVFEIKGYDQDFDIKEMFGGLLGLAAHETMYDLLKKYDQND